MSVEPNNQAVYRTAESVSPKHPDKICDQISDAILNAYLAKDPQARVAIEACGGHGALFLTGEISSSELVDVKQIARRLAGDVKIIKRITRQSPEIAQGVDAGGAGDQGVIIGYACAETPELLPLEYALARALNRFLYEKWPYDGKTQVTTYDGQIAAMTTDRKSVV